VEGDERLRLFCGFPLRGDAVDALVAWQRAELRGGRIVPPDNLHVTLAFLRSRPAADVAAVRAALESAVDGAGRIVLAVRGYRETRNVGMLTLDDAEGNATAVAERLHARLESLGLCRREARRWLPHVTVLRFDRPPRLRPPLPELGAVSPSDAAVYLSRLRSGGAQYEVLEAVALGGR
jgi:RNA 2',3'-cyclic 3'-phosphodiesterase